MKRCIILRNKLEELNTKLRYLSIFSTITIFILNYFHIHIYNYLVFVIATAGTNHTGSSRVNYAHLA